MRTVMWCITLLVMTMTVGCAVSRSKPIIDPEGVDMGQYQDDLAQCEQIAQQVEQKTGSGAAEGALVGGLIGAIIGGSDSAIKGAGVGGVSGGASGASATEREKAVVVKNCLRNRGYRILN